MGFKAMCLQFKQCIYHLLAVLVFLSMLSLPVLLINALVRAINSGSGYTVSFYSGEDFRVFLSDVVTMVGSGDLFGIWVSGGRINEIVYVSPNAVNRIIVEEFIDQHIGSSRLLYEFSGYDVKVWLDPSISIHTVAIQGFKGFLHSICLDKPHTVVFTIRNTANGYYSYITSGGLQTVVLAFDTLYIALAIDSRTAKISVEEGQHPIVKISAAYPCSSILIFIGTDVVKLIDTVETLDFSYVLSAIDVGRRRYLELVSMFPSVYTDVKQIQDLYYASLYVKLNVLLYPEVLDSTKPGLFAGYTVLVKMLQMGYGVDLGSVLNAIYSRLNLSSPYDLFIGMEVAKVLDDQQKISEICTKVSTVRAENHMDEVFISRVRLICSLGDGEAMPMPKDITPLDALVLRELGLIEELPPQVGKVGVENLTLTPTLWRCLAIPQLLQMKMWSLSDIISMLSTTGLEHICSDFIILRGVAGIRIIDNVLILRPSIPMFLSSLRIDMWIRGRGVSLVYIGYGDRVKSIELNGVPIYTTLIPLHLLLDKDNEIKVELARQLTTLRLAVLNKGIPLKRIPIYIVTAYGGIQLQSVAITDDSGRAEAVTLPGGYATIIVNLSDIGMLSIKTWVRGGEEIIVDVASLIQPIELVRNELLTLSSRVSELSKEMEAIKKSVTQTADEAQGYTMFAIQTLAIVISSIALSLSLITSMKLLVWKGKGGGA